jgi:hypothetical protein
MTRRHLRGLQDRAELLRGRPLHEQVRVVSQAALRAAGLLHLPPVSFPASPPPPAEHLVRRPQLRVAGVLDHFSHAAFQYEFTFESLRCETWREQMERFDPHLLLVESAWSGEQGSWAGRIAGFRGPSPELEQLMLWARRRGVPSVFWSKEDPPNYLRFIAAARLFDHVFTVDADSVERYERDLGHRRTGVLPFAAQPRIHHPFTALGIRDRHPVAFAGAYYRQKYAERRHQMELLLDPARDFGLHIYSRVESRGSNRWPRKYRNHIVGTLPYAEMVEAYKSYAVFLNVSSVVNSRTMCPRRVFELLAAATPVLTTPTRGIDELIGPNCVAQSGSEEQSRTELRRLLNSEPERARQRAIGLRAVLHAHTYRHRVEQILAATLGDLPLSRRGVAVIAHLGDRPGDDDTAYVLRRWATLPGVEQVILGGSDRAAAWAKKATIGTNSVVQRAEREAGWYAQALAAASTSHVAFVDPRHQYGDHFFADALRLLDSDEACAVGKARYQRKTSGRSELVGAGQEYQRGAAVHPRTLVIELAAARRAVAHPTDGPAGLPRSSVVSSDRYEFIERPPSVAPAETALVSTRVDTTDKERPC